MLHFVFEHIEYIIGYKIFLHCIMSPLSLPCHLDGSSIYSNRCVYVMCLANINNLVALPYIPSIDIDWYLYLE